MGSRGKAPVGRLGDYKLKQNVKLAYNFKRFPVQRLGFNECRSRAWTVYFAKQLLWNSAAALTVPIWDRASLRLW